MTVREIHNTVRSMLGHISASRGRSWEPEEIDTAFNIKVGEFIGARATYFAAGEMSSTEDIQSLIVMEKTLTARHLFGGVSEVLLPANYGHMLDTRLLGSYSCGNTPPVITPVTETTYQVILIDTPKSAAPFYETVTLDIAGIAPITIPTTTRTDKKNNLDIYAQLKYEAEKNGIYVEGNRLISKGFAFNVIVDGTTLNRTTATASIKNMPNYTDELMSSKVSAVELEKRRNTPYYGNHKSHVLIVPGSSSGSNIRNLNLHASQNCIVSKAVLAYIRKPRPISLILGSDTDLPDNNKVHELLCKMTVTSLMGDAKDDRYVKNLQEQIRAFDNRPI